MREVYENTSLDAMLKAKRPKQSERSARLAILKDAHIVVATLSGAGSQVCSPHADSLCCPLFNVKIH
jgi:hypothetical protein